MFHGNRWAGVFVRALGEGATEGLVCLKELTGVIKKINDTLYGYTVAVRLEKVLRESVGVCGAGAMNECTEKVIRFICLMVEKRHFDGIDIVIQEIEDLLEKQNKILSVTVETASVLEPSFEEELKQRIMQETGAVQVKMKTETFPELLGGYKLRFGGYYVDASLRGQLEKMKTSLEEAALGMSGGYNG